LGHIIEHANSDVGGGVDLIHDGLEVFHHEETFFGGATPIDGEAVLRQRCKIPPTSGITPLTKNSISAKLVMPLAKYEMAYLSWTARPYTFKITLTAGVVVL
jgi:hypothetical protein